MPAKYLSKHKNQKRPRDEIVRKGESIQIFLLKGETKKCASG